MDKKTARQRLPNESLLGRIWRLLLSDADTAVMATLRALYWLLVAFYVTAIVAGVVVYPAYILIKMIL